MNAVVVLNKPKGFTSQETVTKIKKILKVKKAGHAGTLDPMARGILIVCINEATKITPFLMELEKEYVFKAKFGISTNTYDADGKIVRVVENFKLEREQVESVLEEFTGEIMQIPPMYSAVKVGGKPLHELARKGVEIERKPKRVIIHSIKIESFEPPFVTFRVVCSKGTYVRSLCYDIGERLGMGAHIVELTRTRVGEFRVEESIELEELKSLLSNDLQPSAFSFQPKKGIFSIDQALYFLPSITMQDYIIPRFLNGNPVKIPSGIVPAGWVKVKDIRGKILGIGYGNGVIIKPERIIWEEG
ncbi:tRNA pseudouridine(55) synthase TruB [Thermodesulfovibrio yellowstonii]|uniref:tRNA pseudouridine synthase B n=1 Tax=Thermodesulfovibrio yellowstonii TaxID=28262 RepID=A0A9W6GHN1_9BACT|nr:tRNA pseudouridine(55) synthase TruB [Thermodesulfovibrio islandicus]GLI54074.1 tRNA pseudouridine synthase B [Thermodesulfovibrio islandicus]